jgi:hypothetical protein
MHTHVVGYTPTMKWMSDLANRVIHAYKILCRPFVGKLTTVDLDRVGPKYTKNLSSPRIFSYLKEKLDLPYCTKNTPGQLMFRSCNIPFSALSVEQCYYMLFFILCHIL